MSVCCECCVLSGRGLCDELITRPEGSYQLCCVILCDLETSRMRPWPTGGAVALKKRYIKLISIKHGDTKTVPGTSSQLFIYCTQCAVHRCLSQYSS
jgi:hypothetical protein